MERNWTTLKEYEEIKFEFFEGIARISINRPRYYNAFTPDTTKEMCDAMVREAMEAIVERYIKGREVTCGLIKKGGKFTIFPVTEIITKNEFFDYEAKYTKGKADEITPADLDPGLTRKCQELASQIYDLTDSSGLIRVDFIIKGNQLYFLELNSIPGMSEESIIPKQVASAGLKMEEVLQWVIDDAITPSQSEI